MLNKQKIFLALFVVVLVGGFGLKVLAVAPTVTITEVMANPDGADANREWIEIYNYGNDPITISGGQASTSWRFKDTTSHLLNLGTSTITLMPGSLVVLASDAATFLTEYQNFLATVIDTTMSLTNAGGQVSISNDNGQTWFEVVNYSTTTEGRSWEKINPTNDNQLSNWQVSLVIGGSPGQLSAININNNQASSTPNQEVEVVVSSTPSSTSEVIVEEQVSSTTEVEVVTQSNNQAEEISQSSASAVVQNNSQSMVKIIINELLPNPIGSDEVGEFIELYNPNSLTINLDGWQLQDQSPMVFTIDEGRVTSTLIFPQSYLTIYRPQSKLVLNNSGSDGARLYNPLGELVDEVNYSEAEEGQSYSLVNGGWVWQGPTPNENNNFAISQNQVVNSASATIVILDNPGLIGRKVKLAATIAGQFKPKTYQWDFGDGIIEEENKVSHLYEQAGQYLIKVIITNATNNTLSATANIVIASSTQGLNKTSQSKLTDETIDLEEIVSDFSQLLEVDAKTIIQLNAVVVASTGVTKKDQIWLGEYDDETGQASTDNLWPLTIGATKPLVGQIIIAPVKVSQLVSGPKLRLAGELKIVDQIAEPNVPEISLVEVNETIKNSLAAVSGIIVKVNQKSLMIADEDNELKIILTKNNLDYKVGDQIKISGLVTMSGKTLVLYPTKIEKISKPSAASTAKQSVAISTTTVPQASNKQPAYIVGGLSVLAGLGWALLKWRSVV